MPDSLSRGYFLLDGPTVNEFADYISTSLTKCPVELNVDIDMLESSFRI